MGVKNLFLIILVAAVTVLARVLNAQNLTCDAGDLRALRELSNGLQTEIEGWGGNSSTNCCHWPGVVCESSASLGLPGGDSVSGRVVRLMLGGRRLVGGLSSAIGDLDQLRLLNLSRNSLNHQIPDSFLRLSNLETVDLSYNDLSGSVPESMNLPAMQFFDISQNNISGALPVGICANSTKLRFLNLSVNYFSGDIPSGLGNCRLLEELCLGTNDLTGNIPDDIFELGNLRRLLVEENKLSGQLSSGIRNLTRLIKLDLSWNMFSGDIPDVFWEMNNLQNFIGYANEFSGSIPSSLSNSESLVFINLRNNSLSGRITLNCTAMTSLVSLDLGSNFFNGPLPDNLPKCRKLRNINLARNTFSGLIPDTYRDFQSLAYLSLSNSSLTNLSSALGILQECRNLTYLILTWNFYDEIFPVDPNMNFPKLRVLIAANSRLRGPIPEWLRKSTNLQLLDLSWNRLSGPVPSWFGIGNFESLFYLDLSNNSLTGEIPKEITSLPSLINRNIALEDASPDFPLFMKRNVSLRGLQYNQVLSLPPTLDLGYNSLSGSIWPEFGNLKKLHILDLRNNFLSGSIPYSLSGMTSLESLDLSYNNLSGRLPSSLASLNFLSKFSVAHNNLSGPIPTGTQFATFPNSSFEGTNLCGDHAPPCPSGRDRNATSRTSHRSIGNGKIVSMAVGVLVGTAFLVGLMILIVWRTHTRGEVDPERDDNSQRERGLSEQESQLLVMFQTMESNYEKLLYEDISKATDNFEQNNIVGCGGFGMVYKATLPDGRKLAIKKLSGDCGQMEREFQAEVETLSRAQHPNLVHLQGYCLDGDVRLLIYSYMENGSLDYWLHEKPDGPAKLDWSMRLKIARGAANGLSYLHQQCDPHILHRDIKSSNILLDEDFEAHLADFGLARLICAYDTHVTTDLVGTLGYIPPEYGQASVATYKGDIYSFGVVLLELLTGKRPMDIGKPKGSRDLISWAIQMKREGREGEVFDQNIYGKQHDKEMLRVFEIACCCLYHNPKDRPSTQLLVSWLDEVDIDS